MGQREQDSSVDVRSPGLVGGERDDRVLSDSLAFFIGGLWQSECCVSVCVCVQTCSYIH